MLWKILLVLSLVAANSFFVAAEFALVKLRFREIKILVRSGKKTAKLLEHLVHRLDSYLSACQLGITLASLGLGWAGEPLVAKMIAPMFRLMGISLENVHYIALPVAFVLVTLILITAGEQVPKFYAIQKYKSIALGVAMPLVLFYKLFKPFIWIINTISNLMLRIMGMQAVSEHYEVHTEDELRAILFESAAGGHLTRKERLIMENVLDLQNKIARRYMLPRNQIVFINKNDSLEEKLHKVSESGHTRLPLCDRDLDRIIGILHVKDIFRALAKNEKLNTLADVARQPAFLPETVTLDVLLQEFQKKHTGLIMLVDEYGVTSGMITLDNVLEELVGPIRDEFDSEAPLIQKKGRNLYEVDAICPLDEIISKFNIELPETNADTIGGVLIEQFGHIPRAKEKIIIGSYLFKVIEAEPVRIRRISIKKLKPENRAKTN
jgi:CBS domain containing-hemolysin-like protein